MVEALLPTELLQTVEDLDRALENVEEQLSNVLPSCTRESFEQLSFVERASTFFALSKSLTVLYSVYLRTNGVSPDDHPANSELYMDNLELYPNFVGCKTMNCFSERVDLYQGKVQKEVDRTTGPRRPGSSLDVKAANRFIEHAIPDLSAEQKKSVRELGKKGPPKRQQERVTTISVRKRRPSGLTIAEEAAAFLAEATTESMVERAGKVCSEKDKLVHL